MPEAKPAAEQRLRINITIARDALVLLDKLAKRRGTNRSALLEELVRVASTQ